MRSKEAKELARKIEAAGGSVEDKGHGKLKVTGPDGSAHIGDSVTAGRAWTQAVKTIERHTGLTL